MPSFYTREHLEKIKLQIMTIFKGLRKKRVGGIENSLWKNIQEALNIYLLISSLDAQGNFRMQAEFSKLGFVSYISCKTDRLVLSCLSLVYHDLVPFKGILYFVSCF